MPRGEQGGRPRRAVPADRHVRHDRRREPRRRRHHVPRHQRAQDPWIGVDKNETHYANHLSSANRPDFWDLDSDPRPIAHHQDVIFVVAMCENDGSSPDAIRGGVRTDLLTARVTNTNRSYDAYVTAMISNMTGSIETRRLEGLDPLNLNEDDLFETVKPLALNAADIDRLNNDLLPVVKTLRFTQRRGNGKVINDYTVTFSFTV